MDTQLSTPQDRTISWAITIGFHAIIIVLLLLFAKFTYPDPPLGSETISVSLARTGNSQSASGATQQGQEISNPTPTPTNNPTPQPTQPAATTPVTTQSSSDVQVSETQPTTTPETTPEEKPREVDDKLNDLFGILTGGGSDQSDGETSGSGIEGTTDGSIDGRGVVGNNKPYGFNLDGRGLMGEPTVDRNFNEEGMVVFDIYVDKDGNLKDVKRNYTLSTTSSDKLFRIGEKALNTVTFSPNPSAPHIQKGQFTFRFALK